MFDYIIIGAGLAGAVAAEQLSHKGKVLVVEQRSHVGGNCYDEYDQNNNLVHKYGPHLFHTDNIDVWKYLSQFTDWQQYNHCVKVYIDGKYVPLPFNLNTLYEVYPKLQAEELEQKLVSTFKYNSQIPINKLMEIEDSKLNSLAGYIYDNIFVNYTEKQWGVSEVDKSVTARVPVRISRDNRYFTDKYQAVPKYGYTKMIQNMLKNVHILLNTQFRDVMRFNGSKFELFGQPYSGTVVYTGRIDDLFGYKYGMLEYRSIDFQFETSDIHLPAATVNYPNNYDYTRITEFKQIHPVKAERTTILKEYPQEYIPSVNVPCYPIFDMENQTKYQKYLEDSKQVENLVLLGRLAEYKYYDMDDVVSRVLAM